jgi:YebC/PmpR family DNA-binding regulatory protein
LLIPLIRGIKGVALTRMNPLALRAFPLIRGIKKHSPVKREVHCPFMISRFDFTAGFCYFKPVQDQGSHPGPENCFLEYLMSGHNKWSSIKHKKGAADAKRGAIFTKIIRELTVSAKSGGGDPNSNPRLRLAIEKAKEANMPKDNVEKAIKKGTGELEGVNYEEMTYEGYGPAGVAVIIDALTDNKNRTSSEIRSMLSKAGGNLGATGCVTFMFEKKGIIIVDNKLVVEEKLFDLVANAGAEDLQNNGEEYEISTPPEAFLTVMNALNKENIATKYSSIDMIPKNTITLDEKKAEQVEKLIEILEEHDDVQSVYSNFARP